MNGLMKKAALGLTLTATALTAAAPADAQRWRGNRGNRGGDVAAGALLGGIVGLGLGAAIASNDRGRYYDRGDYYDRGYYYNAPPQVIYRERFRGPRRFYRGYYDGYAPRGYYRAPRYRGYYGY
ncbi:hypothetical protein [Sphingomonas sp.]|jgi:hypothetical protein|uniref:hypothetical protein n=1 Tax=Sphingomonas sp. TaxID=28214 RepID=UPI002EDAD541